MRGIQDIIKEATERYDLTYDESQRSPTIKLNDGTIKEIKKEDLELVFQLKD
ncbi:hypothetical protein [Heyndrickxia camelliae]|uniref:hypothetical protein n=1 Tax=Heyndrickxia camelliae TaxID=1707093 RepID=UPI0013FD4860|nr:hypothetical protein [Heyndrickxia camelliae]